MWIYSRPYFLASFISLTPTYSLSLSLDFPTPPVSLWEQQLEPDVHYCPQDSDSDSALTSVTLGIKKHMFDFEKVMLYKLYWQSSTHSDPKRLIPNRDHWAAVSPACNFLSINQLCFRLLCKGFSDSYGMLMIFDSCYRSAGELLLHHYLCCGAGFERALPLVHPIYFQRLQTHLPLCIRISIS
jgi:hypothetical protein